MVLCTLLMQGLGMGEHRRRLVSLSKGATDGCWHTSLYLYQHWLRIAKARVKVKQNQKRNTGEVQMASCWQEVVNIGRKEGQTRSCHQEKTRNSREPWRFDPVLDVDLLAATGAVQYILGTSKGDSAQERKYMFIILLCRQPIAVIL